MAAGHAAFLGRLTTSSSTGFSCFPFPSSTAKSKLLTRVKLPVGRMPCSAVIVSPKIERKHPVISFPHIEAPIAWCFQDLEFRDNREERKTGDAGWSKSKENSKEKRNREILNDDASSSHTDIAAKLPWMDPSLRYVNVMWFKGAYNAQIFVSPDESEDSVVRRFRHAVAGAGVLRECYRRRYRETPQDVIKRKQKQAALHRKKRRRYDSNSINAYTWPKESSGYSNKTKKKKESRSRPGSDAAQKVAPEAYELDDDDFWGYTEEDDQK